MNEQALPHVLVVDDEPLAASGIAGFLARKGYRTTVAYGGHEALKLHAADAADLVITDMRMPGGGGQMLIAGLLRLNPHLPIIVVTGQMELGEMVFGGNPPVLKKPVDLRELMALVARMIAAR